MKLNMFCLNVTVLQQRLLGKPSLKKSVTFVALGSFKVQVQY